MRAKYFAVALAAAVIVAPLAVAQAETPNVNVYGSLRVALDDAKNGTTTSGTSGADRTRVSNGNSFLGFKGSEKLGEGLNAVYQAEAGVNADGIVTNAGAVEAGGTSGGTSYFTPRNTYVGIKQDAAGMVLMGIHDTPYKISTSGKLDFFVDTLADYNGIFGAGAIAGFDLRPANTIAYMSPNWAGLSVAAAYVNGAELASGASGAIKGNASSVMANFDKGPIYVAVAYEQHKFGTGGTGNVSGTSPKTTETANTTTGAITSTTTYSNEGKKESAYKVGVGYTIGGAGTKLGAVYEKTKDNASSSGGNSKGHASYMVNVAQPIGIAAIKLAYLVAGDNATADTGAKQYTLGVDLNLSARTVVYALYTNLNNDPAGTYGLGQGGTALVATGAGADPSGFSVGFRHTF